MKSEVRRVEEKLFTKQDIATRWKLTIKTINTYIADGILIPAKGIPSIRFTPQHIAELEGIEINKFSPLERKRMLREVKELENKITDLENKNLELKEYVASIVGNGVRLIGLGKEVQQ